MEKKKETRKCPCDKKICIFEEFKLYKTRKRYAELEILKIKEILRKKLNEPYW